MYRQLSRPAEGGVMGSFKVKLVVYFVLLSLLPLAAAFWGFSTVAARSETRRVDARLQAGLRAALPPYQEALGSPGPAAEKLGPTPSLPRAPPSRDPPAPPPGPPPPAPPPAPA